MVKIKNDYNSKEEIFEAILHYNQILDNNDIPVMNRFFPLKKKYKKFFEGESIMVIGTNLIFFGK